MTTEAWIKRNTHSLAGKTVAITGSTGGLGRELCRFLLRLEASLILLDRSESRSQAWRMELLEAFPHADIRCIRVDLEDLASVREAAEVLSGLNIDVFYHNAGAYSIPRQVTEEGFDNVFQINFVAPYYLIRRLLPQLRARGGRVVVVGSIAHRYSVTDPADVDFRSRAKASLVYGNAKRYLMFSLYELFRREEAVALAVTHPGITFTNITAHYPPLIFALIKHPMKVIFMKPRRACLSLLRGLFEDCGDGEWIGPRVFDVWGLPKKSRLRSAEEAEQREIGRIAEKIYEEIGKNDGNLE